MNQWMLGSFGCPNIVRDSQMDEFLKTTSISILIVISVETSTNTTRNLSFYDIYSATLG